MSCEVIAPYTTSGILLAARGSTAESVSRNRRLRRSAARRHSAAAGSLSGLQAYLAVMAIGYFGDQTYSQKGKKEENPEFIQGCMQPSGSQGKVMVFVHKQNWSKKHS
jgi:hypothetical protein